MRYEALVGGIVAEESQWFRKWLLQRSLGAAISSRYSRVTTIQHLENPLQLKGL